MFVLFVPCGTSILHEATCWRKLSRYRGRLPSPLPGQIETQRAGVVRQIMARDEVDRTTLLEQFDAQYFGSNSERLSAELSSVDKIIVDLRRRNPGERGQIVLLHGQDRDGRAAGQMNRILLDARFPEMVRTEPIFGLDPTDDKGFRRSLEDLWSRIESVSNEAKREDPEAYGLVNFTGGYKGTLIYLAVRIARADKQRFIRRGYYLYVESQQLCTFLDPDSQRPWDFQDAITDYAADAPAGL